MTRWIALVVSALLLVPLAGSPAPASAAAAACKQQAGLTANEWLGGSGSWSEASRWSLGTVPGGTADDYACLPTGSRVTIDAATPRVDLDLLVVGADARLTLSPRTSLFLWGDQLLYRSVSGRGSVIDVDGATFGGTGRMRVGGRLSAHRSADGAPATLTSGLGSRAFKATGAKAGILEVGDHAKLVVSGTGDVRIASAYVVDVRGLARLSGRAGLVADHGASVLLQRHFYGHQVGRLVITDDRGVRSGRPFAGKRRATLVNRGVIVKRKSTGISTIGTLYVAGRVVARSGHVVVPGQAVAPQTATSPPVTTCPPFLPCTCRRLEGCTDDQSAVLKLPASDTDGPGTTTVEPLAGEQVKGAVGVPMQVHASDLDATLADPAVIQLRYDVALFTDAGEPADPTTVSVGHADGANQPYDDVPACAGNAIPLGAFACIDHTASRIVSGTLVAVIRTTDTSRWIIH